MSEHTFDPCGITRARVEALYDQGLVEQAAALAAEIDQLQIAVWLGRMETVV